MNPDLLHPRCSTDQCVRCRKKFEAGDRVGMALIVEKIGRNPTSKEVGAFLSAEFELSHIDCADSKLNGRILS